MELKYKIQQALNKTTDRKSFIQELLVNTLDWPIPSFLTDLDDMSYEWSDEDLNAAGLTEKSLSGPVLQMQKIVDNQPWGIFILEFENPDIFTTGRGLTTPLRKVLRGLIPKRQRSSKLPAWDRENLLFICTHNYQDFRFAYFKPAKEKGQAEPLAMFGWDSGDATLRTLCEYNLPFLIWSDNPQQPQWREAFNVEKVTKGFYSQVAKLFTDLVGGVRKEGSKTYQGKNLLIVPGRQNDTIRKEFAVRLIGRLVFCWFLKKKKSKDGVPLLPQELLSTESINNKGIGGYYHSILEPLFFEVLNTPVDERSKLFSSEPWSIIPFLNGGLFTPHEDDFYKLTFNGISEHLNDLNIPDGWIRGLFEVFETYNFTIEESTPLDIEVAVDPEILGRIFENLLAEINPETGETARKATGSYYTPRPIVEYMVDESLKQYLLTKTKLPEEKISALLSYASETPDLTDSQKDEVLDALDTVKVIDPACGSGAFLMGILQKILLILPKIDPDSKKWLGRILSRINDSTFKKDLERKLKRESLEYVHKLGIIRDAIYGVDIQPIAVEIAKLRCFLSLIVDETIDDTQSNRGVEPLPNLEFKFVCANTLIGLGGDMLLTNEAAKKIDELKKVREEYLNSYGKEKKELEVKFLRIRSELSRLPFNWQKGSEKALKLAEWNPFSDKSCPWFDPEWMFGVKDGFDIVIGNPPYINIENIPKKDRQYYLSEYGENGSLGKRYDLYQIFILKSIKLFGSNSILSFILPNTFLVGHSYLTLRKQMTKKTSIHKVIDLPQNVFESGTVDNVLLFIKTPYNKDNKIKIHTLSSDASIKRIERSDWDDDFILPQCELTEENQFRINVHSNPVKKKIYEKYFLNSELLGNITESSQGIIIYKTEEDSEEGLYTSSEFQKGWKKLLRGTNIGLYQTKWGGEYINYGDWLWSQRAEKFFTEPKILLQALRNKSLARRLVATFDDKKFYNAHNLANIISKKNSCYDLKYILSIFNSTPINNWYKDHFPNVNINPNDFRSIPIKKITSKNQEPFIKLVDKILQAKEENPKADTSKLEKQLDKMVYALYGLTAAEIAIIQKT